MAFATKRQSASTLNRLPSRALHCQIARVPIRSCRTLIHNRRELNKRRSRMLEVCVAKCRIRRTTSHAVPRRRIADEYQHSRTITKLSRFQAR